MNYTVIPEPNYIKYEQGSFPLSGDVAIKGEWSGFNKNYLMGFLERKGTLSIKEAAENVISFETEPMLGIEAYTITISKTEVKLKSNGKQGQFYALVTLSQLCFGQSEIACMEIRDEPRYDYRGFLIDVCRHFIPKNELFRLIEIAALSKLNKLHLHLTDDQGWRIEISSYPKLTEVGAKRKGSGVVGYEEENCEYKNNGYYTTEDIKDIIQFASDRNIEVIPEIDLPGHFSAAAAAYPELLCVPHVVEVRLKAGISSDILCIGNEDNYIFIEKVLSEIFELFPSPIVHLGGDEVFKASWVNCKKCLSIVEKNHLKTPFEMQTYFSNKLIEVATGYGKQVILWNDAFVDRNLDNSAICQHWNSMGRTDTLKELLAQKKSEIIDSNFSAYYLDYPIEAVSLKTTYNYQSIFDADGFKLKGVETALWTEIVPSKSVLNARLFPRFFAFAESAWTKKENKDYVSFKNRIFLLADYYSQYGITYDNRNKWEYSGLRAKIELFKHMKRLLPKGMLKTMGEINRINKIRF